MKKYGQIFNGEQVMDVKCKSCGSPSMDPTKGIKFCSVCGAGAGAPLPRKEVISVQHLRAAELINDAIETTKQEYKIALAKRSHGSCKCMVDYLGELTKILNTLEVYREQKSGDSEVKP